MDAKNKYFHFFAFLKSFTVLQTTLASIKLPLVLAVATPPSAELVPFRRDSEAE